MNTETIIVFVNLFCVGILAGEEFTIRFGVRAPLASLDERAHIQLRQALIHRLRVVVPLIFALTTLSAIAVTVAAGFDQGFGFRCAGLLALLAFITITLTGTVPINKAALTWNPVMLPHNWRALVNTWEQLDTLRCLAAITAFVLFLIAVAVQ